MNKLFSTSRKGQSAIEYLMTYGWMLLVVAIVGGAVITTVQNNQSECKGDIPTTLDATQKGFGVTNFGVGGGNAQVVLKNNGQDDITVTEVQVNGNTASTTASDTTLTLNEKTKWTVSGSNAENCNDIEIAITYDKGSISGQQMNGTITTKATVP